MEGVQKITKRRRKVRGVGEPSPWEPRHMRLNNVRYAETSGGAEGLRNVTLGVVQHLWRSPVPFIGFYPPEGVTVVEGRIYTPEAARRVDDAEYLSGVEEHKRSFARDLEQTMLGSGSLPGYFEVPTDVGWRVVLDLPGSRFEMVDAWNFSNSSRVIGDLAPFVWAYRHSGFCLLSVYDRDIGSLRDDLLFFAKREGLELRWNRTAA